MLIKAIILASVVLVSAQAAEIRVTSGLKSVKVDGREATIDLADITGLSVRGLAPSISQSSDSSGQRLLATFPNIPNIDIQNGILIISDDMAQPTASETVAAASSSNTDSASIRLSGRIPSEAATIHVPANTNEGSSVQPGGQVLNDIPEVEEPTTRPPNPNANGGETDDPSIMLGSGSKIAFGKKAEYLKKEFSSNLTVPESPAATVVGTQGRVIRMQNLREVGTHLINNIDPNGNLQSGFSIAFRPYRLAAKPSLDEYLYGTSGGTNLKDGRWIRFLSNIDVSLAATVDQIDMGATSDSGSTLAFGLSGFVFNKADPRFHARDVVDLLNDLEPGTGPGQSGWGPSTDQDMTTAVENYWKEVDARIWNNSYWAYGIAPRWKSFDGGFSDYSFDGGAVWTTFGYGFEGASKLKLGILEDKSQLLLHSAYKDSMTVTNPMDSTMTLEEDSFLLASQLRVGGSGFNVFGELAYEKHNPNTIASYDSLTYTLGIEKRLRKDLWLNLEIGSTDVENGDDGAFIRTALNFAFGDSLNPK